MDKKEIMIIKFEWDEKLGKCWMNPDNLAILLYTKTLTKMDLLQCEVIDLDQLINSTREECMLSDDDFETVKELRDLMEDVCEGIYEPDSFTTQPINSFIAKQQAIRDKKC